MPDFGQTQTTQIPSAVQEHYDRNLLEHSQSALVHGLFAQKKKITESTDTIKFRKYALLPKATIPLVEGVNPTPHRLAREDITARVSTYGAYVEVTDEVEILNVDPILTVASDRTGRQAGETLDELVKNVINAGANVMWAGGVASRNNIVSGVTVEDFRKINRAMQNLNSPYFYEHIKAGTGQGTQPIKPSYLCITHPDVIYDLEQLTGWVPVSQYGNAAAIHDYEVGALGNFRFISTTEAKRFPGAGGSAGGGSKKATGGNNDVYTILVLSKDGYGQVDLKEGGIKTIIKSKEQVGGPLNRFSTVGWLARTVTKILDETKIYRYEVAVSA